MTKFSGRASPPASAVSGPPASDRAEASPTPAASNDTSSTPQILTTDLLSSSAGRPARAGAPLHPEAAPAAPHGLQFAGFVRSHNMSRSGPVFCSLPFDKRAIAALDGMPRSAGARLQAHPRHPERLRAAHVADRVAPSQRAAALKVRRPNRAAALKGRYRGRGAAPPGGPLVFCSLSPLWRPFRARSCCGLPVSRGAGRHPGLHMWRCFAALVGRPGRAESDMARRRAAGYEGGAKAPHSRERRSCLSHNSTLSAACPLECAALCERAACYRSCDLPACRRAARKQACRQAAGFARLCFFPDGGAALSPASLPGTNCATTDSSAGPGRSAFRLSFLVLFLLQGLPVGEGDEPVLLILLPPGQARGGALLGGLPLQVRPAVRTALDDVQHPVVAPLRASPSRAAGRRRPAG